VVVVVVIAVVAEIAYLNTSFGYVGAEKNKKIKNKNKKILYSNPTWP